MTTTDYRTKAEKDAAELFAIETAQHTMAALFEQGMYRHLRFTAERGTAWFDINTWPHNLVVNGGHGSYHFRVLDGKPDLFALFRDSARGGGINAGYWAEKVRAGETKSWSEDSFRKWVREQGSRLEAAHPGTTQALHEDVLDSTWHSLEYESTARYALSQFEHDGVRIRFPEEWEQSFQDFDHHYLWLCHAIVWGIAQYDAAKAPAPAEAVA